MGERSAALEDAATLCDEEAALSVDMYRTIREALAARIRALKGTVASASLPKLAAKCRPAVAHYMRVQQRAAMSESLSVTGKQAAEKEAAWLGQLLDEIDTLLGARDVPPHRSGSGHEPM